MCPRNTRSARSRSRWTSRARSPANPSSGVSNSQVVFEHFADLVVTEHAVGGQRVSTVHLQHSVFKGDPHARLVLDILKPDQLQSVAHGGLPHFILADH